MHHRNQEIGIRSQKRPFIGVKVVSVVLPFDVSGYDEGAPEREGRPGETEGLNDGVHGAGQLHAELGLLSGVHVRLVAYNPSDCSRRLGCVVRCRVQWLAMDVGREVCSQWGNGAATAANRYLPEQERTLSAQFYHTL